MIRSGQVAIGFNPEMVKLALGEPSRETTIESAGGRRIVWEYRELAPSIGLGVGGGVGTRGSGIGIGSGVGLSPTRTKLLKRITFDRITGDVDSVESYN